MTFPRITAALNRMKLLIAELLIRSAMKGKGHSTRFEKAGEAAADEVRYFREVHHPRRDRP